MTSLDTLSSRTAKLVYLYLSERGAATVDELSAALDERQLKLLPVLSTLADEGLVQKDGERYIPA